MATDLKNSLLCKTVFKSERSDFAAVSTPEERDSIRGVKLSIRCLMDSLNRCKDASAR